MKRIIPLMILMLLVMVFPVLAQTYAVTDELAIVGGSKDSLYVSTDIDTKLLDSLFAFVERGDSLNYRFLAAPVPIGITATAADIVKDTVLIKADTSVKPGSKGYTWQDFQQAFGGAVPPILRLYLFVDKDASSFWRRLKTAAIVVKQHERD